MRIRCGRRRATTSARLADIPSSSGSNRIEVALRRLLDHNGQTLPAAEEKRRLQHQPSDGWSDSTVTVGAGRLPKLRSGTRRVSVLARR